MVRYSFIRVFVPNNDQYNVKNYTKNSSKPKLQYIFIPIADNRNDCNNNIQYDL
jgi:hypothetical protein